MFSIYTLSAIVLALQVNAIPTDTATFASETDIPCSYIVQLKNNIDLESHIASAPIEPHYNITSSFELPSFKGFTGVFNDSVIQSIRNSPQVANVYPDLIHYGAGTKIEIAPSTEEFTVASSPDKDGICVQESPSNWGLSRISTNFSGCASGRPYYYPSQAGEGVTAIVVDSGFNIRDPEFGGRAFPGYNAFYPGYEPVDDNGHGSNVAGIIGSNTYGVAKKINLVPVKVLDSNSMGTTASILNGFQWIARNYAHKKNIIVNFSITGPADYVIELAQSSLSNLGITIVGCAGNQGGDACYYDPGNNYKNVITVGNIQLDNALHTAYEPSNYGPCVSIFAPGTRIPSTSNRIGWYSIYTGTSQAAPHVSGVVALFYSLGASKSNIRQLLAQHSTKNILTNLRGSTNQLVYNNAGRPLNVTNSFFKY